MFHGNGDLLDQITLQHGPHKLLARFFLIAQQHAHDKGVILRLSSDFARMQRIRRCYVDIPPTTSPHWDPAHSDFPIDSSFWIEGVNAAGETVLTHAARFFDWPRTTLKDELESLRIHFRDPKPHLAAGESMTITSPSAERITGRNTFAGAMWVRDDHRRRGLTRIVPRISRAYAYTRWKTAFTWGLMDPMLHEYGVSRAYGRYTVEPSMHANLACWPHSNGVLLWMTHETLLQEINDVVAHATNDLSRKIDIPSTMVSSPRRHGSRTRP